MTTSHSVWPGPGQGRFISQQCITGPNFTTRSSELFTHWCQWCTGEGEDPGTQTAFSLALTNREFDKKPTAAGNVWKGLLQLVPARSAPATWPPSSTVPPKIWRA